MPAIGKRNPSKVEPSHEALGLAIRELRGEVGLTQAELATKTGHPTSYLSELENGKRNPTWAVLADLSKILGVRLAQLVERAETK